MHQLIHYNMGSKSAIGIGNGICFKQVRDKGGGSYIDPLVRDSIVGLWKFDQNTNESPTRNIIKNTIKDKGGDLELLNFAYKANSGYNGYPEDFTSWGPSNVEVSKGGNKAKNTKVDFNLLYTYSDIKRDIEPFKVKISNFTKGIIRYWYRQEDGIETILLLEPITVNNSKGLIELPKSYNTVENGTGFKGGFKGNDTNIGVTIEQLPLYEGALVTDGKDDMIVSQKTVQEMLGGSKKITVVSMIHQIGRVATNTNLFTNCIQYNTGSKGHNIVNYQTSLGKTGIYGYSRANVSVANNEVVINNILGDKADYLTNVSIGALTSNEKFSVVGYLDVSPQQVTSVAVYWTFIANKVLTPDEINQIIAYFKLDKYVTPQVIYDVKRQGLTNDTPAADWYLKDFSGNGHDMQLYNYAKSKDSGIGKYAEDFTEKKFIKYNGCVYTKSTIISSSNQQNITAKAYNNVSFPKLIIRVKGLNEGNKLIITYPTRTDNTVPENLTINADGIYELIDSYNALSDWFSIGALIPQDGISVEQIPDYEGALVSDGKDDYGKAEGLPIFKDYTVAIDRAWTNNLVKGQCLASKLNGDNFGSFSFELIENGFSSYSFGISNKGVITMDSNKKISYQSKYVYNGSPIISGNNVDGKDLFLFRNRDSYPYYAEAAIWSYILFPYSLSEFLLERQLKRYKLGTLYPDMVEFRPIVKSNSEYQVIDYYIDNLPAVVGKYYPIDSNLRIAVVTKGVVDEVSSLIINGVSFGTPNVVNNRFTFNGTLSSKSPQKIDITIDEYIRYEDIVQPYPAIINLKQDGKTITWGDKLKVGSDIVFVESANLLPELYTVSETRYNGVTLYPNTIIKVEKSMVFDNARTYLKANEPNCILSPNRLRIPNSSYKILRYIPDLTGKGNHGIINNSTYAGMSGANGYKYNWNTWRISKSGITCTVTDSRLHITSLKGQYNPNQALFESNTVANTDNKSNFKVNITGLTSDMKCTFNNAGSIIKELINGVNEISVDLVAGWYGFMITSLDGSVIGDCDITIQQIGQYEGSFCLDGVDDYITIPTLAHGGKCMLMKVNWNKDALMLYDQRMDNNPNSFAIYIPNFNNEDSIAYSSRNDGKTYIDGVLNTSVKGSQLKDVTHNITITNSNPNNYNITSPVIGSNAKHNAFYAQMALFDFMLFPDISSEEEIKELNDIVGIEGGYVESPNYYYDAYGKKNTDTDRNLIADQVSKDVANALEVKNVAYNSESGYTDDNGLLLDGV